MTVWTRSPLSPAALRPLRLPACMALLAFTLGTTTPARAADIAATAPPDHSVKAPHYGDVLYNFYQDRYFSAITTLMVSQHFQRLTLHEDEAEILRGGMLLSYGMHREAGDVFSRLIERGAEPAVRDRAWFYLAKVRFVRGLPEDALAALSRVEGALPPELEDERGLLAAQVKLALDDPAGAAAALSTLASAPKGSRPSASATPPRKLSILSRLKVAVLSPFGGTDPLANPDGDATLYARYNLGVALIRGGDAEQGAHWLDDLGRMPAANEEQRRLRDQANLALGFSALQREEPEQARQWLERVRLNGRCGNEKARTRLGALDGTGGARPGRFGGAGSAHRPALCPGRAG